MISSQACVENSRPCMELETQRSIGSMSTLSGWRAYSSREGEHRHVLHHEEKGIMLVVHGDDFTVLGHDGSLDWFRKVYSREV